MEQEYKKTFPKSKAFNVGTKEELKLPLLKYNQPFYYEVCLMNLEMMCSSVSCLIFGIVL